MLEALPASLAAQGHEVSVVLPCYNEKVVIEESTAELVRVLEATRLSWEIIFVDDVSKDDTVARAERLCAPARCYARA